MKSREEVIAGLRYLCGCHAAACGPVGDAREFLEPAIALLTPPTTAEIEAARKEAQEALRVAAALKRITAQDNPYVQVWETMLAGLDALAREPILETKVEYLSELRDSLSRTLEENAKRVRALEADIARVTEEREIAKADALILAHSYQHDSNPPQSVVARALAYRGAALAADAGPEVK